MAKQKPATKPVEEEETPKPKAKGTRKPKAAEPEPVEEPTPPPAPVAKAKSKPKAAEADSDADDGAETAKARTKSQILDYLADATGLERKQVSEVFDALGQLIKEDLGEEGPGVVKLPGLIKLERKVREATPETMKPNPFRPGEMMTVKAKPRSVEVKVRALKELKELES